MVNFLQSRRDFLIGTASLVASTRQSLSAANSATGTFERPFNSRSLWNARPIAPELGVARIPAENNKAYLEQSIEWGSRLFRATAADGPVVVQGRDNPAGVWVADELQIRNVVIPHFPHDAVPASGSDGHCEIFDEATGLIHSFYRLILDPERKVWRAAKYTASSVGGTGWGSPERPDGPRASGTPSSSGILRAHEVGSDIVSHALAVAAHANVFKSGPIFPATLEDRNGFEGYSGSFPIGTLFMLPPDFEADRLNWPHSRTIARTLKVFGARLIDQTIGSFSFAGEIGSEWSQYVGRYNVWHPSWAEDLTKIRDSLRPLVSTSRWLDADGKEFTPLSWEQMNLLSMRGPWARLEGPTNTAGKYETAANLFLFPEVSSPLVYRKTIRLRDDKAREPWFQWMSGCWYMNPLPDREYRLRAEGFGDAIASLEIRGDNVFFSSTDIRVGQEAKINWPSGATLTSVTVRTPPGPPSGIRLALELI
jgi:hypothetical protein